MTNLPNLAGVATQDLVQSIGSGSYSASYINWSRTMQLLREHAPGWLPETLMAADSSLLHPAPVGAYLLIRMVHEDGRTTPSVPQAVMNNTHKAIPLDKITACDITNAQRRGLCLVLAQQFGLAHELWAKMPLESGYSEPEPEPVTTINATPTGGAWEAQSEESQAFLLKIAAEILTRVANDPDDALDYYESQKLDADEKIALWTRLDSKVRSTIKKAHLKKVSK